MRYVADIEVARRLAMSGTLLWIGIVAILAAIFAAKADIQVNATGLLLVHGLPIQLRKSDGETAPGNFRRVGICKQTLTFG